MKTVQDVLIMSTSEVVKAATKQLLSFYKNVYYYKEDFIYAVGENPITIVAHMDTVRDGYSGLGRKPYAKGHDLPVGLILNRNIITNAHGVLGADDRAGVFGCLELVRRCKKAKVALPSVILTNGEESGGIGVSTFVESAIFTKKGGDKTTKLFVEMDRQGSNEYVTYGSTLPLSVERYVESFGFNEDHGSYSDIADLQEEYLIPAVNVSIGYYKQHTSNERLHLDEMYMSINRVFNMLKDPIDKLYPVEAWRGYGSMLQLTSYCDSGSGKPYGVYEIPKDKGNTTTSTTRTVDTTIPMDSVGREDIDEVLEMITFSGYCNECGLKWTDCDCGAIIKSLFSWFDVIDLEFLQKSYLSKSDRVYIDIETLKKDTESGIFEGEPPVVEEDEVDESSPFYVEEGK